MDYLTILEDYLLSVDNLPSEIQHVLNELRNTNPEINALETRIHQQDCALRKLIRNSSQKPEDIKPQNIPTDLPDAELLPVLQEMASNMLQDTPDHLKIYTQVEEEYAKSKELANNRVELIERVLDMMEKHIKRLEAELEKVDDEIPSSSTVAATPGNVPTTAPIFATPATTDINKLKASVSVTKNASVLETPIAPALSIFF